MRWVWTLCWGWYFGEKEGEGELDREIMIEREGEGE
jgi:hypothetical protein